VSAGDAPSPSPLFLAGSRKMTREQHLTRASLSSDSLPRLPPSSRRRLVFSSRSPSRSHG
jgi:hypothetical protein